VLSSRIEDTQATLGEVLKFEAGEEIEEQSRREDIYEIVTIQPPITGIQGLLSNVRRSAPRTFIPCFLAVEI
jgi:hypothetical protein